MTTHDLIIIIGVNIGSIVVMCTFLIWVFNKLDTDIKNIGIKVDGLSKRLDGHAMRIDQLYHMFIDLLKQGKK